MSAASVQWAGMAEFRRLLRELPVALRDRAVDIVDNAAHTTESQLLQAYPLGDTGNLRGGVSVAETMQPVGVLERVTSKSPHAQLWEFGTKNRKTKQGWDRGRIRPARDLGQQGLVAIAVRNRRVMNNALIQMLIDEGFDVSGVLNALD
jgi:hypothetical protein